MAYTSDSTSNETFLVRSYAHDDKEHTTFPSLNQKISNLHSTNKK